MGSRFNTARLMEKMAMNRRNSSSPARITCPLNCPMRIGPPTLRGETSPVKRSPTKPTVSEIQSQVSRAPTATAPMAPGRSRWIAVSTPIRPTVESVAAPPSGPSATREASGTTVRVTRPPSRTMTISIGSPARGDTTVSKSCQIRMGRPPA